MEWRVECLKCSYNDLTVDFEFSGQAWRGLEQNPQTQSRWAQLARAGKKVMQFLNAGRYVAVVVEGRAIFYSKSR